MVHDPTRRGERPPPPQYTWATGMPEDALVTVFTVKPEHGGMRLDGWLATEMSRLTRTRAQRICDDFVFTDTGRKLRPSHRVRGHDVVVVYRPRWDEPEAPRDVPVVYADDHLVAVSKPAGLPVHPTARFHQNTLTTILGELFPGERVVLCHRLDRETSGIVLAARTPAAERVVKTAFADRTVHKTYQAIVHGTVREDAFTVDAPLALDGGEVSVRMAVKPANQGGMPSVTRVTVLERLDGFTRVAAHPETGRQHQIRVHLAHAGFPIVGDKLYAHGDEVFLAALTGLTEALRALLLLDRHALHAYAVALDHPFTGQPIRLEAPLPGDMKTFCETHKGESGIALDAPAARVVGRTP